MKGEPRHAAALLAVLLALGITSALVVGGAYVARQLATASRITDRGSALAAAPEEAVLRALVTWDVVSRGAQAIGTTVEVASWASGRVHVATTASRASDRVWWIVASATDGAKPLLRKRLGLLVLSDSSGVRPAPQRAWMPLP